MNIDIISQVCVYCDYPVWRYLLQKYRGNFKKIIAFPSRHHGKIDCENFLKKHCPQFTWVEETKIDWTTPGIDWRQTETDRCLPYSQAEWILFMEQDFFVDNWDKLWTDVTKAMKTSDVIGWWNPTSSPYLHPCFLLIKREVLEKTQKDFSAHAERSGADHFETVTRDLERLGAHVTKLQDLGWLNWESAFHLGGMTYTFQDWKGDGTDHFGVGNVEAFYVYNYQSMLAPVFHDELYLALAKQVGQTLEKRFPRVNPETSKWTKFFKLF